MDNCLVSLQGVRCQLDRDSLLNNIDWRIESGQQWAVLGRNGAGKTALAQLIARRLPVSSGKLEYAAGFDPASDIAWVSFELQKSLCEHDQRLDMSELSEAAFDPGTTAQQALLQGAEPPPEFAQLCRRYGLQQVLETGIRYLSSGEMRKVLILRALLRKPRLLILDEPLEGLDRSIRHEIAALLQQAMTGGQQTLLLSRHTDELLEQADHLLLIDKLQIIAAGTSSEVQQSEAWRQLFPPLPPLPERLPGPYSDRAPELVNTEAAPIEALDLQVEYQGKTVFTKLDLIVKAGDQVAISGPNGCGKSTLLNLLCGENHQAYGQQVKLFGHQRGTGETLWQVKALFGVVSNQVQTKYIRGWNALEVVISGLYDSIGLYQSYGASEENLARSWLAALQLEEQARELFHRLSFGQQRVVLLARAMISHPPLLVLDEPCTGLDQFNRDWILQLVDHMVATTGTQLLFVSHREEDLPRCINRRLMFEKNDLGHYSLREQQ